MTTTKFTHTGLAAGTTYYYKIRYYKRVNGVTAFSNYSSPITVKTTGVAITVPNTSGLTTTNITDNSIALKWNGNPSITGCQVYYSTSLNGDYKTIATVASGMTTTKFTHTGLAAGTTYYYKIRYYKRVNGVTAFSNYSSPITVKTTGTAAKKIATVNCDYLNMRSGAGTTYGIITVLQNGEKVTILDSVNLSTGKLWYKVSYTYSSKTYTGYMDSTYLTIS